MNRLKELPTFRLLKTAQYAFDSTMRGEDIVLHFNTDVFKPGDLLVPVGTDLAFIVLNLPERSNSFIGGIYKVQPTRPTDGKWRKEWFDEGARWVRSGCVYPDTGWGPAIKEKSFPCEAPVKAAGQKLILSPKDNLGKITLENVTAYALEGPTLLVVFEDGSTRNYPLQHLWYYSSHVNYHRQKNDGQ